MQHEEEQLHTGTTSNHTHHPSEGELGDCLHSEWLNAAAAATTTTSAAPVLDTYVEDCSAESADSSNGSGSSSGSDSSSAAVAAAQHLQSLVIADQYGLSVGGPTACGDALCVSNSSNSSGACDLEIVSASARGRSYSI
jgi:hypothetical protein